MSLLLLLALPISCAVKMQLAYHQFRQASKPFEELGGHVSGPEMGPLGGAAGITRLYLERTTISDDDLLRLRPQLESLPNLEALGLRDTQVTDAGLEHLRGLTKLETLFLDNTQVTNCGSNSPTLD